MVAPCVYVGYTMSNHYGSIQNLGTANPQNISVLHNHAHFRPNIFHFVNGIERSDKMTRIFLYSVVSCSHVVLLIYIDKATGRSSGHVLQILGTDLKQKIVHRNCGAWHFLFDEHVSLM
jgi:hypothetical protein